MDVRSAFNSGIAGFQDASAQVSNSSARIAQVSVTDNGNQQASASNSSPAVREPISLTTELVNLKVAEHQAKASAKVISTADEVMGTLINTSV